jgi:hypothetical protein
VPFRETSIAVMRRYCFFEIWLGKIRFIFLSSLVFYHAQVRPCITEHFRDARPRDGPSPLTDHDWQTMCDAVGVLEACAEVDRTVRSMHFAGLTPALVLVNELQDYLQVRPVPSKLLSTSSSQGYLNAFLLILFFIHFFFPFEHIAFILNMLIQ